MKHLLLALALAGAAFFAGVPANAQQMSIEDAAWLAGRWTGEGFGGQLEETWSAPAGNQMVGHFRMVEDGRPAFYELLLLEEHDGALRYRVKHFNPDFTGWEEKDGFHEFSWVGATPDELRFEGLVIRRVGADASDHILQVRARDGSVREEVLHYRRAPE